MASDGSGGGMVRASFTISTKISYSSNKKAALAAMRSENSDFVLLVAALFSSITFVRFPKPRANLHSRTSRSHSTFSINPRAFALVSTLFILITKSSKVPLAIVINASITSRPLSPIPKYLLTKSTPLCI